MEIITLIWAIIVILAIIAVTNIYHAVRGQKASDDIINFMRIISEKLLKVENAQRQQDSKNKKTWRLLLELEERVCRFEATDEEDDC